MKRINSYWTTEDVAKNTGIALSTIKWWIAEDKIPSFKVGRHRRFDPVEVKKWWIQACKGNA